MKPFVAFALAASLVLAACDRTPQPKTNAAPATPSAAPTTPSTPSAAGSGPSAPTTPAPQTSSAPTTSEKQESANPQQGQVDPKDGSQHKDFEQKGDSAGPKNPEAAPKSN